MSYNKIVNPRTGKKVSIFGKSGSSILQSYYNYLIKNESGTMKGGAGPYDEEKNMPKEFINNEEEEKNMPKEFINNEIVVQDAATKMGSGSVSPSSGPVVKGADINEEVFSDFYKNNEFIKQLKDHVKQNISGKKIIDAVNSFAKDGFDMSLLTVAAETDPNIEAYIKPLFNFTIQTIQNLIGIDTPIKLFKRDASGNIDSSGYIHISGSEISNEKLKNILLVEKKRLYPAGNYPFKIADKICLDLSGSLQSHIDNMNLQITDISGKTINGDGEPNYKYATEKEYIINIKSLFETLKSELNEKYQSLLLESISPK